MSKMKIHKDYEIELQGSSYEVLEQYRGVDVNILHRHLLCGFMWEVSPSTIKLIRIPYTKFLSISSILDEELV